MARPYNVMQNPVFPPYVCIQCGVGSGRREWFIDLGFTVDQYFDVDNYAIYLCNECYNAMTRDVSILLQRFRQSHERWDGGESPSYSWLESKNVRSREQSSGINVGAGSYATTTLSSDRNDQDTESNDTEPESANSGNADSIDDSNSNESAGLKVVPFGTK